jgi:hypothetical protein
MGINLEVQERKVILSHIDNIINQAVDNQLVECLYILAIQLSPAKSDQRKRYTTLLKDLRSVEGQLTIESTPISNLAEFSASNGYYYFRIKDDPFGRSAKITQSVLKADFKFTWKKPSGPWQLKQNGKLPLNIDNFISIITPKLNDDFKRFKKS